MLVNIADRRARTYAPDSKEYKEQLEAAAKRYAELFEKNEERIGGLQARNFEGKVYSDLDQNDKAIEIFREMLTLPDGSGAIRNMKRQSFLWLMETLLKPNVKKYDEAMEAAAKWKDDAIPNELASPEGLRIQLLAGQACLEAAKALDPKDEKRRGLVRSARGYLEFVQRAPRIDPEGCQQPADGQLLRRRGSKRGRTEDVRRGLRAGKRGLAPNAHHRRPDASGNRSEAAAELSDQVAAASESAARYCRLTLEMANKQTDPSQVNTVRFYPDISLFHGRSTPRCGRDGRAPRIPVSPKPRCPQGCRDRHQSLSKTIRHGTPGRPRYDLRNGPDAASRTVRDHSLARRSCGRRSMDHALRHSHRPAGYSEGRPSIWRNFRPIRPEEPAPNCDWDRPIGPSMSASHRWKKESGQARRNWTRLAKKAQDTLRQGIDRLSKAVDAGGEIDYPLAYSVLALAQILIDAGNPEEAGRWLDDPKIGPMTLIAANNPAVAGRTDFQIDTYKAALRAYVGTEKIEQAETVMGKLEELVGQDDETGAARLTQIYISLGRQLEELLTRLRTEGKTDQIQKVSQGFERFLDSISKREKGNSFSSLNWVAQTFASLAAGHDPGDGPLPEAAVKYYESAGATYYRVAQDASCRHAEGAETVIKVQMAVCLRALGRRQDEADPKKSEKNFTQALGLLVAILKERETRVDVQMEAARTYQELASASGQASFYLNAILGGQKQSDGHNLVWGWNGISRRVGSREEYRPILYEARYNIALCRMRIAQTTDRGRANGDTPPGGKRHPGHSQTLSNLGRCRNGSRNMMRCSKQFGNSRETTIHKG